MKGKTTESPTITLHRYCQGFNSCVLFLLLILSVFMFCLQYVCILHACMVLKEVRSDIRFQLMALNSKTIITGLLRRFSEQKCLPPEDQSSIPRTHMEEEESQLYRMSSDLHMHTIACAHSQIHKNVVKIQNKKIHHYYSFKENQMFEWVKPDKLSHKKKGFL